MFLRLLREKQRNLLENLMTIKKLIFVATYTLKEARKVALIVSLCFPEHYYLTCILNVRNMIQNSDGHKLTS